MDFLDAYTLIYNSGMQNEVRKQRVREDRNLTVQVPYNAFPRRRDDNPAIGFMEGIQFIAGTAELAPLKSVAPHAKHELFGMNSYYGPRCMSQFPRVIEELRSNVGTRRAVVMVAHPDDSPETMPCTLSLQFQRHTADSTTLYTTVTMRSSDLVWGMPYDMIQFCMVAHAVTCCVGMSAFDVKICTANAHIYDATAIYPTEWSRVRYIIPRSYVEWGQWVQWARGIVYADPPMSRADILRMFGVQSKKGGDAALQ